MRRDGRLFLEHHNPRGCVPLVQRTCGRQPDNAPSDNDHIGAFHRAAG
jgi:hypothetical protein